MNIPRLNALCPTYGDWWIALFNTTPYTWRKARNRFIGVRGQRAFDQTRATHADLMGHWWESGTEDCQLLLEELVRASDARGTRLRKRVEGGGS